MLLYIILIHYIVHYNEVNKSMGQQFRRLYLHKNAFNLIPQMEKNQKVKEKNMILKCLCPHVGCVPVIKYCYHHIAVHMKSTF